MKTKADIDAELARLERRLPELLQECEPDEALEAFAGEAERLVESAPAEHVEHVHATISCMLASAGVIPGDNGGEQCVATGPWRVEVERAELFAGQPEQAVGWVLVNDAGEKYQEHAPAVWISLDRAAAEQKRDELNAAE